VTARNGAFQNNLWHSLIADGEIKFIHSVHIDKTGKKRKL